MSQINVSNVTFHYEDSYESIFENVSFTMDTDWKLGFIGRNGKGKTTFLNLLLQKYPYQGRIHATTMFDYFPYTMTKGQMEQCACDIVEEFHPDTELWRVICELEKLRVDASVLYRPFHTLSQGEQTKVMLSMLFARENFFLLIDEPTNHLDEDAREQVKQYLSTKKGFILVSHDRDLLDACIDHVLVLNRNSIVIEKGNFSTWWENKEKKDSFEQAENEKHLQEIAKLKKASVQSNLWATKNENTKIGFDPIKEHDRSIASRSYIGAKTKKMQSKKKQMQQRMEREIEEKEGLLKDIEQVVDLKMMPLTHHKQVYVRAKEFGLSYGRDINQKKVLHDVSIEIAAGERVLLKGANGCGKSSFLKAVLEAAGYEREGSFSSTIKEETGTLQVASGLILSYLNQDTSFLKGTLSAYIEKNELDETLLKSLLRQLDFERTQFEKKMEDYSQGQKKKLLIATSLMTKAHLYIWDEPFNHIDVFTRMQIENLILKYKPTMLFVEHDPVFAKKVATRVITLERYI